MNDHFQGLVLQWFKGLGGAVVVHSSSVKRRARAIEKLHRFYYGDSGWIIDLVRRIHHVSIVGCVAVVRAAVGRMKVADSTVGIVQIKNRFDTDYDSACRQGT